jgi:UDPglucose 6-dehydrogenase
VWGLSFKPQTDDMREAPSIVIIRMLLEAGATIIAYDPEAMEEARHVFGESIEYASSATGATDGCDALLLVTEWNEFRTPRWSDLFHRMAEAVVFDGRNIYPRDKLEAAGFEYHCVGRR